MVRGRVLVVDDELGVRNLLKEVLSRREYDVEVAEDGPSGIARAKERSFDVAFLDIRMPGMDGVDTLKALMELRPEMQVAMITGCTDSARVGEALSIGASVCLCKHFGIRDILDTVEMLQACRL